MFPSQPEKPFCSGVTFKALAGVDDLSVQPPRALRETLFKNKPASLFRVLIQRERTVAVDSQVEVPRIEYGAYPRLHCFGVEEEVASQAGHGHG